jgi:hypothetical protein
LDEAGQLAGLVENKPGSAGSVRVYAYLLAKWGAINRCAAKEGLEIYGEHKAGSRRCPGKHPNIDGLLEVEKTGSVMRLKASWA